MTPTFNWSVSTGTITSGQGTDRIHVEGLERDEITATLDVGGFAGSCATTASATMRPADAQAGLAAGQCRLPARESLSNLSDEDVATIRKLADAAIIVADVALSSSANADEGALMRARCGILRSRVEVKAVLAGRSRDADAGQLLTALDKQLGRVVDAEARLQSRAGTRCNPSGTRNRPPVIADGTPGWIPQAVGNRRVALSVEASDPDRDALRFGWVVSGGRVMGSGARVTWDLTHVSSGVYHATAEVEDIRGCTAFSSVTVNVR